MCVIEEINRETMIVPETMGIYTQKRRLGGTSSLQAT